MKISQLLISVLAVTILAASAYAILRIKPDIVPEPIKEALPAASNLRSFEFLGCSGDWSDEKIVPQAWRAGSKARTTFLVRHPADCGYTIGADPKARIIGSSIDFSYAMSNDDGTLAACYCEYWATFELKSAPGEITKISINVEGAQLMSGLSER